MLFNSYSFFIFFPLTVLIYFIFPKRLKNFWLLLASWYFYMGWDPRFIVLLIGSTLITWVGALGIEYVREKARNDGSTAYKSAKYDRAILILTLVINFGVLFFFKYSVFVFNNITLTLRALGLTLPETKFSVILPVGISFFTFQAVGYTIDVYRKDIYAEKNFLKYALFVAFFPQLVAGPIERSKNLLKQLDKTYSFNRDNFKEGLLLMLWGYFLKLMIADRAALYVNTVYGNFYTYTGVYIVMATVLFAFQIYCDFAGYSIIAMGASKILGINLMDNFNCPYFSRSVAEFWRRWHISLSTWFRDYLYIPLGGNRRGKHRKWLNIMIVFVFSGLWHGASWGFVAWGGLNGLYQVFGELFRGMSKKVKALLEIREESFSHKLFKAVFTFGLINISWIFFRAEGFMTAMRIGKQMLIHPNLSALLSGSIFACGMPIKEFFVLFVSIVLLLWADYMKYKGIVLRKALLRQDLWFRWLVYAGSVTVIAVMGIWGSSYDASSFIYFQF